MCQPNNAVAKLLLLAIMAATVIFLITTLPPADAGQAAVWLR